MTQPVAPPPPRTWDGRLARRLVTPLRDTRVTPNHLTTLRLAIGVAGAAALAHGGPAWSNAGALLVVLSNFVDHTDGELARISGKTSRFGHFYDLASDAVVTVLLFACIGIGVAADGVVLWLPPVLLGVVAGIAVAAIFYVRMQIEERVGKSATTQSFAGGFETEDVLYLLPLVTLTGATVPFLVAASIGAPLFAAWVLVDYRGVLRRARPGAALGDRPVAASTAFAADAVAAGREPAVLDASVVDSDVRELRKAFVRQGAFLALDRFVSADIANGLARHADALLPEVNRNYLPGHKKGGSVSRHSIDRLAPAIAGLYRSEALIAALEAICGDRLLACPADDPHAYALYYYTRPGDHIGWHYDTSYYDGRRYTLLIGVTDRSSCRLDYELHTRDDGAAVEAGSLRIAPGGMVFFDGDRLRHRITPLGDDEMRVSLTFEYVTDPRMRPSLRLFSNLKDAFGYFGFRQLFRGRRRADGDAGSGR